MVINNAIVNSKRIFQLFILLAGLTLLPAMGATTNTAHSCTMPGSWLIFKIRARSIIDRSSYETIAHACFDHPNRNLTIPNTLCVVDCGRTHNATAVEITTDIVDKEKKIHTISKFRIGKCYNKSCFIHTCRNFFLHYRLKHHCSDQYAKALKAHDHSKKITANTNQS